MPTYEYECRKCGYSFEKFQSMTDTPVKRCPKCKCAVNRLIGTGAGIIFKGSGFYQTDYKPAAGTGNSSGKGQQSPDRSGKGEDTAPCGKADNCSSCPGSVNK